MAEDFHIRLAWPRVVFAMRLGAEPVVHARVFGAETHQNDAKNRAGEKTGTGVIHGRGKRLLLRSRRALQHIHAGGIARLYLIPLETFLDAAPHLAAHRVLLPWAGFHQQ